MNTTNTPTTIGQKLRALLERLSTFTVTLSIESGEGGVLTTRFRSEPIRLRPTCKEFLAHIPEVFADAATSATVTFRRGNPEPLSSGLNSKFKEWVIDHCRRVAAIYFQHAKPLPIDGYILQAQDYLRVVTPLVEERNLAMQYFLTMIDISLFCPGCFTKKLDPDAVTRISHGLVATPTVVITGRPKFMGLDCQIPTQIREPLEKELKLAIIELLHELAVENAVTENAKATANTTTHSGQAEAEAPHEKPDVIN